LDGVDSRFPDRADLRLAVRHHQARYRVAARTPRCGRST
jgi:hypothetical protein